MKNRIHISKPTDHRFIIFYLIILKPFQQQIDRSNIDYRLFWAQVEHVIRFFIVLLSIH